MNSMGNEFSRALVLSSKVGDLQKTNVVHAAHLVGHAGQRAFGPASLCTTQHCTTTTGCFHGPEVSTQQLSPWHVAPPQVVFELSPV